MASLNLSQAQYTICCEICEKREGINWFCVNCEEYLYNDCKYTHTKTKKTREDIIIERRLADLRNIIPPPHSKLCTKHSEHINFTCNTCNVQVCFECIWYDHNQTDNHKISENIPEIDKETEKELQKLEALLYQQSQFCAKYKDTVREDIEKQRAMKQKLQSEIEERANALIMEVTLAKDIMIKRASNIYANRLELLKDKRGICTKKYEELEKTRKDLDQKQKSGNYLGLKTFIRKKFRERRNFNLPDVQDACNLTLVPKGKIDDIFGNFENSKHHLQNDPGEKLIKYNTEVSSIDTKTNRIIGSICSVSDEMAWIAYSNRNNVQKIKSNGDKIKELETPFPVLDMDVKDDRYMVLTSSSNVILTDLAHQEPAFRTVKEFHHFKAKGVCFADGNNLQMLVCIKTEKPQTAEKVVKLSLEGEVIMEICEGENGLLLCDPYRVTQNCITGDIAVICGREVIVFSQTGEFKFKWGGLEGAKASFNPHGIIYDHNGTGNIIVTSHSDHSVYVLDPDGENARVLINDNTYHGLLNPWGLSVDFTGRLWIGCWQGICKIIKYSHKYD